MIARFFNWWIGELLGLLPRRAARALGLGRDRLIVVVRAERAVLALESAAGRRELGAVPLAHGEGEVSARAVEQAVDGVDLERCDVLVLLAEDRALRRNVMLPAGHGDVRRALEREIERYTPFRAEQVYFLYAIDPQPGGDGAASVELAVAPRRFLDPMVDRLVSLGAERRAARVGIVGIDAVLPAGTGREAEDMPEQPAGLPRGMGAALIAVAALALTALSAPTLQLFLARQDMAGRAALAEKDAEQVRRLLGEIERQSAGLEAILTARAEAPSVVRVLDRLSALLPDDTFLDQFNVAGREIEIEGTTRAGAALVRTLESERSFEKVTYVAPVTRDPVTGAERFHFSIQYAGRKPLPVK